MKTDTSVMDLAYANGAFSPGAEGYLPRWPSAAADLRAYAPLDPTLHRIAENLQAAQRQNFYQLSAEVTHRGNYYHAFTMAVSVSRDSAAAVEIIGDAESIVTDALRDLANWLYRQLEQEYDYLTSDEAVDETLIVGGGVAANSRLRAMLGQRAEHLDVLVIAPFVAVGDPRLVADLKAGRRPRQRTTERLLNYLLISEGRIPENCCINHGQN